MKKKMMTHKEPRPKFKSFSKTISQPFEKPKTTMELKEKEDKEPKSLGFSTSAKNRPKPS